MLRSSASRAHHQRDRLGHPGEEHGGLAGRVGAADDVDVGVDAVGRLGRGGAVEEPAAGEVADAGRVQVAVGDAGRDDDGVRRDLDAVAEPHHPRRPVGRAGPVTSRAVRISAPNLVACRRARSVSWAPETPSGKPR